MGAEMKTENACGYYDSPLSATDKRRTGLTLNKAALLVRQLVEEFGMQFARNGRLLYVSYARTRHGYLNESGFRALGLNASAVNEMPDVVIHQPDRSRLFLCDANTGRGVMDAQRHRELQILFARCATRLIFVTAFSSRKVMTRHLAAISWETEVEVWCAESPTHLIHFNDKRLLGPY